MQVFLDANQQRIPLYYLIAANSASLLSRLRIPADALADIQNALAAGLEVVVPERTPAKAVGVAGIGYEIRDPATGSASYRIRGGTNGGDGMTPCAKRQLTPLVQAVFETVTTTIVLTALAVALAPTGETAAAPAALLLRQLMASMGLEFLTFRATAGAAFCNPTPVERNNNGKNAIHNQCANTRIGNRYPDHDACVWAPGFDKPKKFDAFNGAILWEVKTYNFNNDVDGFFRATVIPNVDMPEAAKERAMAKACGYGFWYTVGDNRHADLLNQLSSGFVPNIADNLEIDAANCLQR